jgi:hypothetical protein
MPQEFRAADPALFSVPDISASFSCGDADDVPAADDPAPFKDWLDQSVDLLRHCVMARPYVSSALV